MQDNGNSPSQQPNHAVWKGHYHSLLQALTVAMQYCWVWRRSDTQQPVTVKDLYETALRYDEENPIQSPQFFMVTREGAIGFSKGYEFLTKWWYIPMEAGPEREQLIEDMRWELKAEFAVEEAIEKAVQEYIARDKANTPPPPPLQTTPPPPPPLPVQPNPTHQPNPLMTTMMVLLFMLLPTAIFAQKKEGQWVEPVQFFHLDKKGNLDLNGIADAMWEAKERYIMGFKATVCNITPIGDEPEDAKIPYSPLTFYVYLNEPTTVTVTSDWTGLPNGDLLGVYTLTASQILFTYDKNSNRYSFDYYPGGSYDWGGGRGLPPEHHSVIPSKADMSLFYTQRGGLRGYYEVTLLQVDDDEELGHSETEDTHYVQFKIDEVLLDGDVKELSEEDRLKLIDQMDDLTKVLKEYMEETGDHAGPIPTTIINIISTIGSVLIGGGIASATGSSVGSVLGVGPSGGGGGGGGAPTPDTPSDGLPPEPEKKKEEETEPKEPEPKEPEDPLGENRAYWNEYMRENPDGTLTMRDPITGKPLNYYPTPDGGYESEMGTHYTPESLAENVRYRAENSGYFKEVGDKAAKDVAEQRAQNERLNAERDAQGQAYREQKAAEEAAEKEAAAREKAQLERLAKHFGLEGEDAQNKYKIYNLLEKEQASAELEHERQMKEAAFYDKAYKAAEVIDTAATTTINVMGELVPGGGRLVKNIYTMAHSVLPAASEAYSKGESIGKAVVNGAIDGGLGILQNQAGDITKNVWVEGTMVVGAEGIKEGLKAITSGKNPDEVLDTMKTAMAHKTNYFLAGKQAEKVIGWVNKSAGQSLSKKGVPLAEDTGLRFSEGTAKTIQKVLTKTDKLDVAKGIASGYQEIGASYTGNWGRDSKVDGIMHDVEYYTNLVKDFSNAASKVKKS